MKSYFQQCGIARALDIVGDRWTLLIVRELLMTDGCRYTDLQAGLPGIASNLLANRIREMEANGLITRTEAPPPVATTLFRLTQRGRELEPVLATLGQWGVPLIERQKSGKPFRSILLKLPIEMNLKGTPQNKTPKIAVLQTGNEPLTLSISSTGVKVRPGTPDRSDLTLSGDPYSILGLLLKKMSLHEALVAGVRLDGDPTVLDSMRMKHVD